MTRALTIVLMMTLAACASGGARRPESPQARPAPASAAGPEDLLRGTWEVAGLEAAGRPRRATGTLSFDEFRNFEVHVELDPGEPGVTPPRTVLLDFRAKASVTGGDAISYLGLEGRMPPERMMISATDPSAWRHFAVEADTLRLWQADETGRPLGTLTFRRLP